MGCRLRQLNQRLGLPSRRLMLALPLEHRPKDRHRLRLLLLHLRERDE
jgi:hypothetical protein